MQLFQMAHMHKLIDYFYVVIASTISSLVKSYWWVLLYPYFYLQLLILHRQASRKCLNLQTGFGARKGLRCQSRPMDPLHLDSDTGKRHISEIFVSSPKESMMTFASERVFLLNNTIWQNFNWNDFLGLNRRGRVSISSKLHFTIPLCVWLNAFIIDFCKCNCVFVFDWMFSLLLV